MNNSLRTIGAILGGLLYIAIYATITSYPIMWLWNTCLVTTVSGVSVITFWKALGIRVLIGLLTFSTKYNNKNQPKDNEA